MEQACGTEGSALQPSLALATSRSLLSLPLLPSHSTLDMNTQGIDGGNTLVDHEVTADYAQTCLCGGSPVHADGERRGSADWQGRDGPTLLLLDQMAGFRHLDADWHAHGGGLRMSDGTSCSWAEMLRVHECFEFRLSTQLAHPQVHNSTGRDSPLIRRLCVHT
ncbi:uncharacterized protein ARMOST_20001 [Armillaria ostoyae]|uniref:Uncharacterized protein n=1 Tax=Armillaria ostoyae TaxID=47428 RepID=A0A284S649_ARMOS|nr:uncharacterized protein ARMOST_20001 [Armillaria ostoyae]